MKKMTLIPFLFILALLYSCTDEEDCTETVCPEGFNNCFEQPCGL